MGKRREVRVKAVGKPTRGMFRGELMPNEWLSSVSLRLSGGLSSRNADPESDGLHVRGAVKARRRLVNAPTRKLVAVNVMPSARIKVYDVMDVDTGKTGVISVNHRLIMHGDCIPITPGKPDEGIWLEKRRKGKVSMAEILKSDHRRRSSYSTTWYPGESILLSSVRVAPRVTTSALFVPATRSGSYDKFGLTEFVIRTTVDTVSSPRQDGAFAPQLQPDGSSLSESLSAPLRGQ